MSSKPSDETEVTEERPPDIVCSGGFKLPPLSLFFGPREEESSGE